MWSKEFWQACIERSIKTFAQMMIAIFGGKAFNIIEADWSGALAVSAGAAFISVMMSIASAQITGGPSLSTEVVIGR